MGASEYRNVGKGKTAQAACDQLVEHARWLHGNGGYTGSIAEKGSMVEFQRPKGMRRTTVFQAIEDIGTIGDKPIYALAMQAKYPKLPIEQMAEMYFDKWGPSLAIELSKGEYLFAGMASE